VTILDIFSNVISKLGMRLKRRNKVLEGLGVFQASSFAYKEGENSMGLRIGGYFLTLEASIHIRNHFTAMDKVKKSDKIRRKKSTESQESLIIAARPVHVVTASVIEMISRTNYPPNQNLGYFDASYIPPIAPPYHNGFVSNQVMVPIFQPQAAAGLSFFVPVEQMYQPSSWMMLH
jgi:hypothetical protein